MKIAAVNLNPMTFGAFWNHKTKQKPYTFYNDDTPCTVSCNLNSEGLRILPVAQEIVRTGAIVNAQKYMDNIKTMENNFRYVRPFTKEIDGNTEIRKAEYALDGNRYVLERKMTETDDETPASTLYTFKADIYNEENNHFCSYERVKKGEKTSVSFILCDPTYGDITLNTDSTSGETYFSITNKSKEYRLKGHYASNPEEIEYTQVEKYVLF